MDLKNNGKSNNGADVQVRVSKDFYDEIEFIKNKRLELGIDKKRKSTKILTDIITKHDFWKEMMEDLVNVKLERIKLLGRNIDE